MSSNLKHVVKRKVHLERSQPHDRKKKFPVLEKHSDYVLRAKDYHKKQGVLRNLREKARTRNPDEFYFKMVHSRLDEKGRYEKVLKKSNEAGDGTSTMSNLLNKNIVQWKQSIELKAVENLRQNLHGKAKPKLHLLFCENSDNDDVVTSAEQQGDNHHLGDALPCRDPELLFDAAKLGIESLKIKRRTRRALTSERSIAEAAEAAETTLESLAKTYKAVVEKKNRLKTLNHASELLDRQKHLATKEHVKVVKGSDGMRNIHVWRLSRKR